MTAPEHNKPEELKHSEDLALNYESQNAFYGEGHKPPQDFGMNDEIWHTQQHEDKEQGYYNDKPVINFSQPTMPSRTCKKCREEFQSNNQLHKHLRQKCNRTKMKEENPLTTTLALDSELTSNPTLMTCPIPTAHPATTALPDIKKLRIIESTSNSKLDTGTGFGFQNWHYVTAGVRLQPEGIQDQICLDTGCSFSLIDAKWLRETLPIVDITKHLVNRFKEHTAVAPSDISNQSRELIQQFTSIRDLCNTTQDSLAPPTYPIEWLTSKRQFQSALQRFEAAAQQHISSSPLTTVTLSQTFTSHETVETAKSSQLTRPEQTGGPCASFNPISPAARCRKTSSILSSRPDFPAPQQRARPFKVVKKIRRLAYQLNIPQH